MNKLISTNTVSAKVISIQSVSFEQDVYLVNRLLLALKNEQTALVATDIDAIEALLDERSALLQSINIAAKNRYEALAINGFEPNEFGMIAWLKRQGKTAIKEAWENFQKALNQAKEMNRLNGILINRHFNRNQQILNQLQNPSSADSIYSRNGHTKSSLLSRAGLVV